MKKIGRTESGAFLVEMSESEMHEFSKLASAVDGNPWPTLMGSNYGIAEQEFSGVFGAIRAFYMAKFGINELRTMIQSFENYLNGERE